MNKYILCIIAVFLCQRSLSQDATILSKDARGNEKMLGIITKQGLTSNSFNSWFTPNFEAYEPNEQIIKKLRRKLKKHTLTIFMGTWCGDSKREVPRFYKILEATGFPQDKLRVIGLNNERDSYKQGPNHEEKGFDIHRVPTFIVFDQKGKEIGRIVEHPVESLEADLLKICRKKPYEHSYQIVTQLQQLIEKKGITHITNHITEIVTHLQPYAKSLKELNTYGYVLLRAKEIDKAITVFTINTHLFPKNKNSYDSLAEAYYEAHNFQAAQKYYRKVLDIDPNDQNAQKMLSQIEK
ncbi:tetratricopeptide repeat protein [Kordia zhangzhouensis]|uniref:tetratricopeptide repeat protein n=1 Tax=Kordia zhangzhouensis TaxID=1620405 RepID=UPI00062960D2|nr:tetratricopeptide repeat protein [Kordia zhangzhouensis]